MKLRIEIETSLTDDGKGLLTRVSLPQLAVEATGTDVIACMKQLQKPAREASERTCAMPDADLSAKGLETRARWVMLESLCDWMLAS